MLTWLSCVALAGPLAVELTDKEVRTLEGGGVVVRSPTDDGTIVGAIDIPTSSEPVFDAVMNFEARVENVGAIQSIQTYAPATDPKGLGARFELSIIGTEVVYHLRYEQDPARHWVTFALDDERDNDIVASTGGYHIVPIASGQRLIYWAHTDVGRSVPGFIRNTLSARSFKSQLGSMRDLAVRTGT